MTALETTPKPSRRTERVILVLAVLWAALAGGLYWQAPETVGLVGSLVPLGLLLLAFGLARQLRVMRSEAAALKENMDALGEIGAELGSTTEGAQAATLALASAMERAAEARARAEAAHAVPPPEPMQMAPRQTPPLTVGTPPGPAPSFASRRHGTEGAVTDREGQGILPIDAPPPPPPLNTADFLQALNFPRDADDTDGFRALRRALKHPETAPLVQAAQDMLTLMSQVGLYMDDLAPDRARPELWHRFAEGERGGPLTALGGIRDEAALETCSVQMRTDPVFRDAAHHLLARFDRVLAGRLATLTDSDLVALADTRTGRAFMLLGRVMGVFD